MVIVRRYFLHTILLLLLCAATATAQDATGVPDTTVQVSTSCHLSGRVIDEDQKPLPFVTVKVEGQMAGTMTTIDGKYSFDFQTADSVVVHYTLIGFEKKTKVLVRPQGKLTWNVTLRNSGTDMGEVVVSEVRRQMGSTQELSTKDLKRMPSTSGNAVEELVATQAGVATHNELSSQYNVRGGSFDENCVYVNGVEIYRPMLVSSGQQEGLSVINSDMVDRVQFSAGGFEAKYGDRMSSVLDITYKRPERHEGSVSASLLGASIYDGFRLGKVSFSQGFRYKTNRYLMGSLQTSGEYDPDFIDYQAYLSWRPTDKWTFDVIGYISRNNYRFKPKDRETNFGTMEDVKSFRVYFDGEEQDLFRTMFGALSLTRKLGSRSALTLGLSAFTTKERETYDIQGQYWLDDTNTSEQLGVGTYMEHARNLLTSRTIAARALYEFKPRGHDIRAGLLFKHETISENTREWEFRDSAGYSIRSWESESYHSTMVHVSAIGHGIRRPFSRPAPASVSCPRRTTTSPSVSPPVCTIRPPSTRSCATPRPPAAPPSSPSTATSRVSALSRL